MKLLSQISKIILPSLQDFLSWARATAILAPTKALFFTSAMSKSWLRKLNIKNKKKQYYSSRSLKMKEKKWKYRHMLKQIIPVNFSQYKHKL
jgi:hypothetical protein